MIGYSVVIEAKPQQFIDEVMVRLEVLCNCCVIRLLHTLLTQRTQQSNFYFGTSPAQLLFPSCFMYSDSIQN